MIKVYLDTSDYRNFLKRDKDASINHVYKYLINQVSAGHIAIGYSQPLLRETIQPITVADDDGHLKQERLQLSEIIKELCHSNAFPALIDYNQGCRFPNGGMWINRASLIDKRDFEKSLKESFIEHKTKVVGNRQERRRMISMLEKAFANYKFTPEMVKAVMRKYGIDEKHFDYYFPKETFESKNLDDLIVRLNSWACCPKQFLLILEHRSEKIPLSVLNTDLSEQLEKLTELFNQAEKLRDENKHLVGDLKNTIKRTNAISGINVFDNISTDLSLYELPMLDLRGRANKYGKFFGSVFDHYIYKVINNQHVPKLSDFMDLAHLAHFREADLFRCDKAMYNCFFDCKSIDQNRLVKNIQLLPDAIEQLKTPPKAG